MAEYSFEISSREVGTRGKRSWTLENDKGGNLSLEEFIEFANKSLVAITDDVLAEELKKGFPKEYVEITDGKIGVPYQQVDIRKRGSIEISALESIEELVTVIFRSIVANSPVDTGRYIDSHLMLFNRQAVAEGASDAVAWARKNNITPKKGDTLQFINYQPYARKLEREGITRNRRNPKIGKTRKGKYKKQNFGLKPNGTYFLATQVARKRFSTGVGKIKFEFIGGEPIFQNLSEISRKTFKLDGRPYLYPSIIIVFSGKGTTQ